MIPWSRGTSNGSLRAQIPGKWRPSSIPANNLFWLGPHKTSRVLSYSAECNYWPAILIRDKLLPTQFLTIIQNILLTTFWDVFCWRFRNASITKPMSRTFGQRPQQDLHDNKTNCSLGRGIQTYFSIYTALHALTVILAKKWKKSKEIKVYFVFSLVSHNTRGQTARQQVCGHNPIETNSQSARSGTWLDAEFKNKNTKTFVFVFLECRMWNLKN